MLVFFIILEIIVMNALDHLLTVRETADYLKLNPITVYDYIRLKTLKAIKLCRYYRIKQEDLTQFMLEHSTQTII